MKNKNCENSLYVCGVCGKSHETIEERAECELSCVKKIKEEERKAAEAKKKAEKETRQQEVTAALDNAFALMNKFTEDYGTYKYNGKIKEDLNMANMDFFPSKLWHHFWF